VGPCGRRFSISGTPSIVVGVWAAFTLRGAPAAVSGVAPLAAGSWQEEQPVAMAAERARTWRE